MRNLIDYRIGRRGDLWVQQSDGAVRRATEKEWLEIWRRDPALTLLLATD
jgi:hypothetical protein